MNDIKIEIKDQDKEFSNPGIEPLEYFATTVKQ